MKNKSKFYNLGSILLVVFLLSSCAGQFNVAKQQSEREFTSFKAIDKKQDKSEKSRTRPASRNKHTWNK